MNGKQAIQRLKNMVERCQYSTMRNIGYVAIQCENGSMVTMENANTVWKWWVTESQQPKLMEITHKSKSAKQTKGETINYV